MLTISEALFERFCRHRGIACTRVPAGATKTPDYEIHVDGVSIAVEVKQLEPNPGDRALCGDLTETGSASGWVDMSRARQSILDGVRQLRTHSKGRQPTIVVLYELVDLLDYLGSDSIAQCMYGPEQIHVAVPHDSKAEPWVLGGSYGGGRIATKTHNTTLSAVGVLRSAGENETLKIFHNVHAAIPLLPDRFRLDGVRHFAWRARDERHRPAWVETTSTAV